MNKVAVPEVLVFVVLIDELIALQAFADYCVVHLATPLGVRPPSPAAEEPRAFRPISFRPIAFVWAEPSALLS